MVTGRFIDMQPPRRPNAYRNCRAMHQNLLIRGYERGHRSQNKWKGFQNGRFWRNPKRYYAVHPRAAAVENCKLQQGWLDAKQAGIRLSNREISFIYDSEAINNSLLRFKTLVLKGITSGRTRFLHFFVKYRFIHKQFLSVLSTIRLFWGDNVLVLILTKFFVLP